MGVILFRKIPALVELPEVSARTNLKGKLLSVKEKSAIPLPFKNFSADVFLQKVLSRVRVLTLRADNKTSDWLQRLRQKNRKMKERRGDNYWQKIRTSLPSKKVSDSLQHSEIEESDKKE